MISIRSCALGESFWCHFGAPGGHFGVILDSKICCLSDLDGCVILINTFCIVRMKKILSQRAKNTLGEISEHGGLT